MNKPSPASGSDPVVGGRKRGRQRHLDAVLSGMLDPVVAIDSMGVIVYANSACEPVLGYRPDELAGEKVELLLPEPYRAEHDGYLARYRRTGESTILGRTREFPVLRKGGVEILCELSISRIDVPGENQPYFCGSFRDITARKSEELALEKSEQRYRSIFHGEYEFVGLLDSAGVLIDINRTAIERTGVTRDEVIGKPFWEAYWWTDSPESGQQMKQAVTRSLDGKFVRFEALARSRTESRITVDFSLQPLAERDGRVVSLIAEGRDITDLKRAQQRESAMMHVFAEIGQSASLLAHEIKNPITAVNLALRAVSKHLGTDEQEILSDLVKRMKKLEQLMRRTLSLARPIAVESAVLDTEALVSSCHDLLRPELENAGISLEIDVAPECPAITGDEGLLEELLTNLIRNAIDALESEGRIRVSAEAEGIFVVIRVDDDGPGIPKNVRDTLFRPFVTTKDSGTGLGLAICRKVAEAHCGSIAADRSPLGGARFELRLPSARTQHEDAPPSPKYVLQ